MINRWTLSTLALVAALSAAYGQTFLGPTTTTVTAGASATMAALGANPSRKAVTICNGHATQTATFTTGTVTPVSLTTGVVLQTGNVATSCFTIGALTGTTPNVGAQINVIASGAATPITFIEYN